MPGWRGAAGTGSGRWGDTHAAIGGGQAGCLLLTSGLVGRSWGVWHARSVPETLERSRAPAELTAGPACCLAAEYPCRGAVAFGSAFCVNVTYPVCFLRPVTLLCTAALGLRRGCFAPHHDWR